MATFTPPAPDEVDEFIPPKPDEFEEPSAIPSIAETPDELGVGEEVRGVGRSLARGLLQFEQGLAAQNLRNIPESLRRLDYAISENQKALDAFDANPISGDAGKRKRESLVARLELAKKTRDEYQPQGARKMADVFTVNQRAIEAIPLTRAQEEFQRPETPWWKFFKNPVELAATTTAESAPQMAVSMLAAPTGPAGVAIATGAGSFSAESSARVKNAMTEQGVDLKDPLQVLDWFASRAKSDPALAKADLAALGPASFDALTAGIAGRWLRGATGKGIKPVAAATAKEIGMQMAGGGIGSIAGNTLAGENIDWKDVVLEMAGELAPSEAIGNVMAERRRGGPDGGGGAPSIETQPAVETPPETFEPPQPTEVEPPTPPTEPAKPVAPQKPFGPDMDTMRRIGAMTPEEFAQNAKGFNKFNIDAGLNATPDEVAELFKLRDEATAVAEQAKKTAEADPTPENIQRMADLGSRPQFFNEAAQLGKMIHETGLKYGGTVRGRHQFTDPVTGSSFAVEEGTQPPDIIAKMNEVRAKFEEYPAYPSLPKGEPPGSNVFKDLSDAIDAWETQVSRWLSKKPEGRPIVWEGSNGNIYALTRNIGNQDRSWRVTTFWPNKAGDALMPAGHREYKSRLDAMIEEAKHAQKFHDDVPKPVMTEKEIQGFKEMSDVKDKSSLKWYSLKSPIGRLREKLRGTTFMEQFVSDSEADGKIAFTEEIPDEHLEYLGLEKVAEEEATFGQAKIPLGIPKSQFDEMRKLSPNDQIKKWGYSTTQLIQKAVLADVAKRKAAEKPQPQKTEAKPAAKPQPAKPSVAVGAKVMVQLRSKSKKYHDAQVTQVFDDGTIQVRITKSGDIHTLKASQVQDRPQTAGKKMFEEEFAELEKPERAQAKKDHAEFMRLIREAGPEHGWLTADATLPTDLKSQGAQVSELVRSAVRRAWIEAKLEGNPESAFDRSKNLAALKKYLEANPGRKLQEAEFERATQEQEGKERQDAGELVVGDKIFVEDTELRVTAKDEKTGELTLEDGRKFGTQIVSEDAILYVDRTELKEGAESIEFEPEEKPPTIPEAVKLSKTKPTLLEYAKSKLPKATADKITEESQVESFRKQWERDYPDTKDITAGQVEDLNLVAESAVDNERIAKEKAEKERIAREAKELEAKQQMDLLADQVAAEAAPEAPPSAKEPTKNVIITDERANAIRDRIAKRRREGRLYTGIDPQEFSEFVQLGAYYIEKGFHRFADWSVEMAKDIGEISEKLLRSIYEQARVTIESPSSESNRNAPPGLQAGLRPPSERIVTAREELTRRADESVIPAELVQHLDPHQRQGAAAAISSMAERGGFLNADGTGAGKTRQALAIAHKFAKDGMRVIIVTKAETIKPNWIKKIFGGSYFNDAKAMGVKIRLAKDSQVAYGEIGVTTYENAAHLERNTDNRTVLIFDEAHALKNDSQRAKFSIRAIAKANSVAFFSATPADKAQHIYYLARMGIMEGKTVQQQLRDLGMTLVEMDKMVKEGDKWVKRRLSFWAEDQRVSDDERNARFNALFERMTAKGAMIKREISMQGTHVQVLKLALPPQAHETMEKILNFFDASHVDDLQGLKKAIVLGHQRRQQEPFKVAPTVMLAQRELAAGRQVVIFVSRVNESEVGKWVKVPGFGGEQERIREVLMSSEGTAKLMREALEDAGIHDIAEIHGNADQASLEAMADFQEGRKRVVIATIESGGTGINLDDTVGNRPRSMIIVTAPFDAVGNVQAAGRIWRLKTLSGANLYYLFGDTDVDAWNADIIGSKMAMLGAIVEGQVRKLDVSNPEFVTTDDYHESVQSTPKEKAPAKAVGGIPKLEWAPFKTKAGKDKFVAPATSEFWKWYNANGKGENPLGWRVSKYKEQWQVWSDKDPNAPDDSAPPSDINTGNLGNIGMGGAKPGEFRGGGSPTAMKYALIDEERQKRGLEALTKPESVSDQAVMDKAMAEIDRNPALPEQLVAELLQNPRPIADWENHVLLLRKIDLRAAYEKSAREAADAYEDSQSFPSRKADMIRANAETARFADMLNDVEIASRVSGSERGRALRALRVMANEDYSLAGLTMGLRAAKNGAPITEAERAALIKIADEYKAANEALQKHNSELERQRSDLEAKLAIEKLKREAAEKKPALPPVIIRKAEELVAKLDSRADKARERLKAKAIRFNTGLDPTTLVDLAEIGASHIGHVGLDFVKWSAKMVEEFGPGIQRHLNAIYDRSQAMLESEGKEPEVAAKAAKTNPMDMAKKTIAKRVKDGRRSSVGPYVQKIARLLVKDGIVEREELIDAVHNILVQIDDTFTRRETMDAISGYGDFRMLSHDEISVALRGMKGEMQQIAKLEDMAAGIPPRKTGLERRTPTDKERELIRAVNEAKIKFQVPITDPMTQLKSALDTRKAQVKARIEEYERRIAEGDFTKKERRKIQKDATLEKLEYDLFQVRKRFHEMQMKARLAARNVPQKILGTFGEITNTLRAVMTSIDLSAVLRQGGFITIAHPVRATRAFVKTLSAMRSDRAAHAIDVAITKRKNYPLYVASKLYLSEHGQKLSQMEEAYMTRWIDYREQVAGQPVRNVARTAANMLLAPTRASARAYTTFLNQIRADSFDAMAATLTPDGNVSKAEAEAIANFVNVATGRGNFGMKENALVGLNSVFFAPRYVASRFQLIGMQPLYRGDAKTRKLIATEYARYMIGLAVVYGLAKMMGAEIDWDRRSADFGKIRFGNTRIDPLSGLSQAIVFLNRMIRGETKVISTGKIKPAKSSDVTIAFLRSKLSPPVGATLDARDLILGQKTPPGHATNLTDLGLGLVYPMNIKDIQAAMQEQGIPAGVAMAIPATLGMSLQTYQTRKSNE